MLGSRHRAAWAVVLVLALLPLMLIVILGSHGRLMGDDFCHLISGLEYGPWGNALYWRNSLNGSFSFYFLHGLTAPLDTQAAGVIVAIIVLAWTFGLAWMILACHQLFRRDRPPLIRTVMMAAALVWLAVHGLATPLSIYFYSAATRHTLPVAIFVVALAACCEYIPRVQSVRRLVAACAIFALVAFVNTGMSEVLGAVQLALLTILLPAVYTMIPREFRRNSLAFVISGLAATVAALLIMATAPGVAKRLAMFGIDTDSPLRVRADLFPKVLEHIQSFLIDRELNTAFIGMLAICLFLMLTVQRSAQTSPVRKPFQLALPPLLLCLLVQLLLLPLVWIHQSDDQFVFAPPPPAYMVVGANISILASLAAIHLGRQRINALLLNRPENWAAIPALTLGVVITLFGLSQLQGINWRAATYVSCSIYTLLFALLWQFHFHFQASGKKSRFFAAVLWAFTVTGVSALALVVLNQAIGDRQFTYNLSFISFAFAFSGFICGISLAYAINQVNATAAPAIRPTLALMYGSAIVATAIWFSILLGNAENVPQFERFSRAWDERHQLILAKRKGGERLATPPRLAKDILKIPGDFRDKYDYWQSNCASDEITGLIKDRYRA